MVNVRCAWWMIAASMLAGALMGLYAFGEPLPAPDRLETYGAVPRRLLRLAHIAAVALPIINLHYVSWMERSPFPEPKRRCAYRLLLAGTLGLPVLLTVAAFFRPALYALPVPVTALLGSIVSLARGLAGNVSPITERTT